MAQDRGSGVTGSDRYGDKSAADHETRIDLTAGRRAEGNYWGPGATTLEWTLSSPPPFHQFETLPHVK